jgi:SAM-dependent methyltransferase
LPDARRDWIELEREFREIAARQVAAIVPADAHHFTEAVAFAAGRLEEGRRVGEFLQLHFGARPLRILDVGAGNGGVSIGVANIAGHDVFSIDLILNWAFVETRRGLRSPAHQAVASGHDLPFAADSFDAVLCLETVEHVPQPEKMGREIMRVLRPGGICMIMTPARFKHVLRRDPHYAVRGLLLLPDSWQRFVVTRILKSTPAALYDVEHTFWTLRGLASLFPGYSAVEPLFNNPQPPGTLWFRFRNYLWDRVLVTK